MIDPTCGSAHFLLGGFHRLFALHQRNHPAVEVRALAQRALDQVYGVDLNPNVVAISRFRLLLAALKVSGIDRLRDAPAFQINVGTGDTLLHGPGQTYLPGTMGDVQHHYERGCRSRATHSRATLPRGGGQPALYHGQGQGNQPALSRAVRFMRWEIFIGGSFYGGLLRAGSEGGARSTSQAGYVGMITANYFMKREFGRKLIEEYIPRWDLTHVIDTSGAYIPGHGTPTVILFGRNRLPLAPTIRTVMGIKGEPATPENPARGLLWTAILNQVDHPSSESEFVSVADSPREKFHWHPWSVGGGGAAELKDRLDEEAAAVLGSVAEQVGITAVTGEDDVFLLPNEKTAHRLGVELVRPIVVGDLVRDWTIDETPVAVWLYNSEFALLSLKELPGTRRFLWLAKAIISRRKRFGTPMLDRGLNWYEWQELYVEKLRTPLTITFAEVASHNHFVLDRGGRVFKNTAQVIKLPAGATESDYSALLGLLNSSVICFRMKQTAHQKQMMGGDGIRIESRAKVPYQFASTQLLKLPIPESFSSGALSRRLLSLAREADSLGAKYEKLGARQALDQSLAANEAPDKRWAAFCEQRERIRSRLILLQEQMDFTVYCMFGLVDDSLFGGGN